MAVRSMAALRGDCARTLGHARYARFNARCAGPCAAIAKAVQPRPDDRPAPRCHDAAMRARAAAPSQSSAACRLPRRAADAIPSIPPGIATHADGRAPIESLYRASLGLVEQGWTAEVIAQSAPAGTSVPLPIIALRSPKTGPAIWILAGIHGEEPAGPNAVAAAIDDIAKLGEQPPGRAAAAPQSRRAMRATGVTSMSPCTRRPSTARASAIPRTCCPSAEDPARPRARGRLEPGGRRDHGLDPAATGGLSGRSSASTCTRTT